MHSGTVTWVCGWAAVSVLLAIVATMVGPGPTVRPGDPSAMVRFPAGSFRLGADGDALDQGPVHAVALRAFEIDRLPVVNAQFAAFLNEQGATNATFGSLADLDRSGARIMQVGSRYAVLAGFEQYPVIVETWQGARAYCAARGARLPSEAEWERAARGVEGRVYPWGNAPPDTSRARFERRMSDYYPVGSYPAGATPDGILDMAGNVAQWTSSRYLPYPYRADDGREDADASGERVIRGGAASAPAELLRSTYRSTVEQRTPPAERPPVTFRCARDVETPV